uniref:Uncharacterized protein n=1 Tax=Brugia malayi TaxID=6279 RepID=A8PG19_BRUMA
MSSSCIVISVEKWHELIEMSSSDIVVSAANDMVISVESAYMTIPHFSFQVFDDLHQLIPSYHEYSITDLLTHSYSPTSGDSAGMPEYFISRGHQ